MLQFTISQRTQRPRCAPRQISRRLSGQNQDGKRVLIPLITARLPTVNGPSMPVHSDRGPHLVPTVGSLIFSKCSKSLTLQSLQLMDHPCPSHCIANHFTIGHPCFQYSNPSTFNSGVLNGCVMEKVSQL